MDTELTYRPDETRATEETLVHATSRVKAGLLWLGTEEAEKMGLSLERLVERATRSSGNLSEEFDLAEISTCAIGYASKYPDQSQYMNVVQAKGNDWVIDHGFYAPYYGVHGDQCRAYDILTDEWRQQLQALNDEVTE